jgi:hypothetical protein
MCVGLNKKRVVFERVCGGRERTERARHEEGAGRAVPRRLPAFAGDVLSRRDGDGKET